MSASSDHGLSGRDENLSGVPAGTSDHPWLGSPDWRLVPQSPDWDEAYLAATAYDEYPGDPDEYEDPDHAPPPGLDDPELEVLIAEARRVTAEQARAAEAAARSGHTAALAAVGAVVAGRRGPGMPGSAETFPGEYASPAGVRDRQAARHPRSAARRWARSRRTRPKTMTGMPGLPMMSWPG